MTDVTEEITAETVSSVVKETAGKSVTEIAAVTTETEAFQLFGFS